jgi:hypothetical protein
MFLCIMSIIVSLGARGRAVLEALCRKLDGRGFEFFFQFT